MKNLLFPLFFTAIIGTHPLACQEIFQQTESPGIFVKTWMNDNPSLTGKHIILEFWATWCGGCIEAIPHLNEMVEKYGKDKVVFISMNSFDNKEKIEKFLGKTAIKTHLAMDDEMKTYYGFNVGAMPKTFLIDKNGYLRWQGVPGLVTDEFMQAFLEKDEILSQKIMEDPLLYSLNISLTKDRSISNVSVFNDAKFGFIWKNRGITDIVFQSYSYIGMKRHEFRFEGKIPLEPALDVELKADHSLSEEFVFNDFVNRLLQMFGHTSKDTIEEMEIWHLSVADEALLKQAKSMDKSKDFSFEETADEWKLYNCEAYRIVRTIVEVSEKTVDTDLSDLTKYNMVIPKNDLNSLIKVLRVQYGLNFEMKNEPVRVKVIQFK